MDFIHTLDSVVSLVSGLVRRPLEVPFCRGLRPCLRQYLGNECQSNLTGTGREEFAAVAL